MLATLEKVAVVDQAEILGKMIVDSEIAEQYRVCLNKMNNSRETQNKIKRFLKLKEQYEEVQRFGRYHPDYKKVMTETRLAKREMDLDDHVANFKRAESELQYLLDEISFLLGRSVSEAVKISAGNPFFESSGGCSTGGCGSGGSCGCS